MTKQDEALYNLTLAQNHLRLVQQLVIQCNPNDGVTQFDYISDPKLANQIDAVYATAKEINDIVYQKYKSL